MSEQYVDILTRLQVINTQLDDGDQKRLYEEIITEITSLRQALTMFSEEFEKIQQQDEARHMDYPPQ